MQRSPFKPPPLPLRDLEPRVAALELALHGTDGQGGVVYQVQSCRAELGWQREFLEAKFHELDLRIETRFGNLDQRIDAAVRNRTSSSMQRITPPSEPPNGNVRVSISAPVKVILIVLAALGAGGGGYLVTQGATQAAPAAASP